MTGRQGLGVAVDVGGSLYGFAPLPATALSPSVAGFGALGVTVGVGVPVGVGVGVTEGVDPIVMGGGVV